MGGTGHQGFYINVCQVTGALNLIKLVKLAERVLELSANPAGVTLKRYQ
jgi:hypothetical protein